jgi:hypothetical protein
MVVRAEDGPRGARRGDDERRDGAEAEEHDAVAAVLGGEVAEGDVREGADEVEVADDGELAGRGWQLAQQQLFSGSSCGGGGSGRRPAAAINPKDEEGEKRTDDEQGQGRGS